MWESILNSVGAVSDREFASLKHYMVEVWIAIGLGDTPTIEFTCKALVVLYWCTVPQRVAKSKDFFDPGEQKSGSRVVE
jgi:hypothetical protein